MKRQLFQKLLIIRLMKLSVVQVVLAVLFTGISVASDLTAQDLLNRRVSLKVENERIRKVLTEIEQVASVKFAYRSQVIPLNKKISLEVVNQPLNEVLDRITIPNGISYEVVGQQIILRPAKKDAFLDVSAELPYRINNDVADRTINGRVTDEKGEGLPGVNIVIKGTTRGTVTDVDGRYQVDVPDNDAVLIFSFVGYVTQEIIVGNRTSIEVTLKTDEKALEEVVVVGYGTQRREQVTSAIASVKAEDFIKGAVQDAAQLIRGKVAGLSIITPDGNPTTTSQIMLRGNATINSSTAPLILIDGVPGSLISVAPEEIESIDVLKDGSAAAIYGTRGTNGVILITTRKVNGEMPPTLEIHSYVNTQHMTRKLDFMSADQYRELVRQNKPGAFDMGANTDWLKETTQVPFSQVHNISLRGGTRNTNYIMSLEYRRLNGVMRKSDNNFIYPRLEINHTMFNGILSFNANVGGYQQSHFSVDGGTYSGLVYRNALTFNPTSPLKDENGRWIEQPEKTDYMNPVALIEESHGRNQNMNFRSFGTITLTPVDGLRFKALFSRETYNSVRGYYETKNHWSTARNGRNGFASRGSTRNEDDLFEFTADYLRDFGGHSVTLLAGYTWRKYNTQNYWMQNWDFPTDDFTYNNIGAGLALRRGQAPESSYQEENKLVGYFFRANYSYQNKYLLMFSIRHEGSSRFGRNNKWGNFPALSLGWNIHRESFLESVRPISNLKLRTGYGVTGTEPGSSYLSLNKLNFNTNVLIDGQWIQAINSSNNPNPNLHWETKEEFNVGVDYGLFNDRITGSIDYYVRTTRDLIASFPVPTPPYLYSSITANAASMRNQGVEISLNVVPVQTQDFVWSSSANFSTNRNKVLSLSNDKFALASGYFDTGNTGEPIQQSTHRVQVGQPIGNFWGFKSVDIDETGHWIIEGRDGQPKPIANQQADDKQIIGNGLPKRYLNWNNTFTYKNFDLNITMRGAFGFQILNMTEMFWSAPVMLTRGNLRANAYEPVYGKRPLADDQSLNYVSYYLEDGDYWKIDNVTLGYNVPKFTKWAKNLRVYGSVSNLFTFTGYKGIDSEVNISGLAPGIDDKNRYPAVTTYTFGVFLSL